MNLRWQAYWFHKWFMRWRECEKLRRQRDVLYEHFYKHVGFFEVLSEELVEVLDEIEKPDVPRPGKGTLES